MLLSKKDSRHIRAAYNPPRPLASRRVDAPTKFQTLQTSQNLQTNLLGGGFTLPLPPPSGPARSVVGRLWDRGERLKPPPRGGVLAARGCGGTPHVGTFYPHFQEIGLEVWGGLGGGQQQANRVRSTFGQLISLRDSRHGISRFRGFVIEIVPTLSLLL